MNTHTGYRETMLTDPETGLVTHFRYGFGKLWHDGFADDPVLDGDGVGEEEAEEAVRAATRRADGVCGRYRSVENATQALIRAGYEPGEVYELEWY